MRFFFFFPSVTPLAGNSALVSQKAPVAIICALTPDSEDVSMHSAT